MKFFTQEWCAWICIVGFGIIVGEIGKWIIGLLGKAVGKN